MDMKLTLAEWTVFCTDGEAWISYDGDERYYNATWAPDNAEVILRVLPIGNIQIKEEDLDIDMLSSPNFDTRAEAIKWLEVVFKAAEEKKDDNLVV